jgi:phospholipid/cholesterol/gamma-HCH transport system substrate-binding protein
LTVHRNEVRAGILVLISLTALGGGLLLLAGSGSLFSSTKVVTAVLANARGIRVGDPVRFAGLRVGQVESLEIRSAAVKAGDGDEGGSGAVRVRIAARLTVPGDLAIPADSSVRVTETLTGARIVEILPGRGGPMAQDAEIVDESLPMGFDDLARRADDLAAGATRTIEQAGNLIERLGGVAASIEKAVESGSVSKILGNLEKSSALIAEGSADLRRTIADIGPIVQDAAEAIRDTGREAKGLMAESRPKFREILARVAAAADDAGKLFEGPDAPVGRIMTKVESAVGRIDDILADLDGVGKEAKEAVAAARPKIVGILDRLKTTGTNLKAASEDLRAHPWKLLNEPDLEDQRVQEIFNAARNFNTGAEVLAEAVRALEASLAAGDAGSPRLKDMLDRLTRSFDRYDRAEGLFWKALRGEKR